MSTGTAFVDEGDAPMSYLSASNIQTVDNDLDSDIVTPASGSPFTGIYDGSSLSISNWSYSSGSVAYIGLFGFSTGKVKNLFLYGTWVLAATEPAGAVGCPLGEMNRGTVFNIDSSCASGTSLTFSGNNCGGIIGTVRNPSTGPGYYTGRYHIYVFLSGQRGRSCRIVSKRGHHELH